MHKWCAFKVYATAISPKTNIINVNCNFLSLLRCASTNYLPPNLPSPPEIKPIPRVYKKPIDWLPFKWDRKPKYNLFQRSGDTIKENSADPSLPKPNFELSEELKTADEHIKKMFSIGNGKKSDINEVCKRQILQRIQRHPNDFKSMEVRIAVKTILIRKLFEHGTLKGRREARYGRVLLGLVIQKRNQMLNILRNSDNDRFLWLMEELQLYYEPAPVDKQRERYCKKWDLRRMTKEFCENMVADKKVAYHEKLKKEQEEFLKEKEEILAWIKEEEKAIAELNV